MDLRRLFRGYRQATISLSTLNEKKRQAVPLIPVLNFEITLEWTPQRAIEALNRKAEVFHSGLSLTRERIVM